MRIAVAASLRPVMNELILRWEEKHGSEIDISSASSGVLTNQIEAGAPFHAFFSANAKYPEYLYRRKIGLKAPFSLVEGQLVFWTRKPLEFLPSQSSMPTFTAWAMPNPSLAPYGLAAQEWLEKEDIQAENMGKMILGENVGQVNQFIFSGSIEAAFTAASAAGVDELIGIGFWTPLETEVPLHHVWLSLKPHPDLHSFEQFLAGKEARSVFENYHYKILN
ncbi:MAG: molybdate ABC transporter substrate-binding protein [Bacteroidota bacterium]